MGILKKPSGGSSGDGDGAAGGGIDMAAGGVLLAPSPTGSWVKFNVTISGGILALASTRDFL